MGETWETQKTTGSFGTSDDNPTIHHNYRKLLESAKEKNRPLFIHLQKMGVDGVIG